ncbi:hypothetical protein VPDG_00141 [Vibrio phage henriette 12B8]|uniref:hypothetical protein n=1 Tax=Vibrio phage henriette 12B8 TaxID=573174 RepID=UPI0002C0B566|nr:hypothetical protein VPDG_00141 [Vibrio phage henriette 12B8]AGG58302.1 hypothetical protein VPDG_00141 [Vibrio phage henriette 12B8]
MKFHLKQPHTGLLDDPEMVAIVEHIFFEGNEAKTKLHRFLALKIYKMHGELDWKDQPKYWEFLAQLDEDDIPKTQSICNKLMEKLNRPDERVQEVNMRIRMPVQLEADALKVKRYRWKKKLLDSKVHSMYDFKKLISYYMSMGLMEEENSIYNLDLTQVYAEVVRLRDKLAAIKL